MLPESTRKKSWLSLTLLLALLLAVGLGALVLRDNAGSAQPAGGPRLNRPAVVDTNGQTPTDYGPTTVKKLDNGVTVIQDAKHDVSPPLRDIPPAAPIIKQEAPENPHPLGAGPPSLRDTVVQRFFGLGPLVMPTPSLTFEGIAQTNSFCSCLPPDTNGDVGPNHYVQTTNLAFEIWDKSGNVVQTSRATNTLWAGFGGPCQTRNDGDPVVNYDSLADRWLIDQFTSSAPYYQCLAVSQTGDPTGAYNRYAFLMSATDLFDYPKTSVWPDAYYMSANVFEATGGFHPAAVAFDRVRMLAGQAATAQLINPGNFYYNLMPADVDGPTAPPAGLPNPYVSTSGTNTTIRLWNFHVDWTQPLSTTFTGPRALQVAPFDPNLCGGARNCIQQPATTARLDAFGGQTMYRFAYRNFGSYQTALISNSVDENGQDHAAIRWYEIRDPAGNPSIYQQGTYAPDADNRWMSSAAMDRDGNIAIGYSVSSGTTFPSIRYAGRLATDPLGVLGQGEATLIAGTGSQTSTSGRWGDYSAMQVDPTDDCTFWYTDEYYPATANSAWHTRIGKFTFPSCGQPAVTPTGTPPTATPTVAASNTPQPTATACANYTIATATGTIVAGTSDTGNHCDDCANPVTLPFPVRLYDQSFTSAYVASNGSIQFATSDFAFGNACLPVPIFGYTVMGYWDDLITQGTGLGVYTSVTGVAPNRVYNVEWRAQVLANNAPINFEFQFPEGSNSFSIVYGTSVGQGGTGATVGVQRDLGAFTQYLCNTAGITAGLQLNFTAPPCGPSPTPQASPTPQVSPTATPTVCTIAFTDVDQNNPFYAYIRCLACRQIVSGYSDGTFRWGNDVTRGQLSKIIAGAAGFTDAIPSGQQTFEDVPSSNAFWVFIERLVAHNAISGYTCGGAGEPCVPPGNRPYFRWTANATRGQIAKIDAIAAGYADVIPTTQQTFEDVPSSNPFWLWIEELASRSIISGYTCGGAGEPCVPPGNRPYFRWTANATRGQMSKIGAQTFFPNCSTPARH